MNWRDLFRPIRSLNVAESQALLSSRPPDQIQVLDVRQPKEYETGHLPHSRLIPLKELPQRLGELDPEKPVLVYCAAGRRSRTAARLLSGEGFKEVYNLAGGIKDWQNIQG
mgnify:CR=1 FL=1